jgi:methylenetetrahydrofolate dehydrogenase (NADP+)/methenyltetrahydrofolate cyclohydrolase
VSSVDKDTEDIRSAALAADVIVSGAGSPGVLKSDMIKHGAVVVDAGVAGEQGKTSGDLDPLIYEVRDDLTITPQKGGVGPLTVCALFENVIRAARSVAPQN